MSSYRRDLDKQQQEITTLKRCHQPPYQGNWNHLPDPHQASPGERGRDRAVLSRSPLRFRVHQPVRAMVLSRKGGGHRVRGRPQPGDTCRNCGERGHWARECRTAEEYRDTPKAPRAVGESVNIVTDGRNGVDVYLALRLNGLLDTGCDSLVISRRVTPNVKFKPTTQKLYAANGMEIALRGEVELTLTISGHEVTAAVVVSEEVNDLILGMDWLGCHRCRWSFAQNLIEIDGKVVRLISRPRQNMPRGIYAVENIVILAGHTTKVPVTMALTSLRQTSGDWAVEPWSLGTRILAARRCEMKGAVRPYR